MIHEALMKHHVLDYFTSQSLMIFNVSIEIINISIKTHLRIINETSMFQILAH